jgi:hypothetical protein
MYQHYVSGATDDPMSLRTASFAPLTKASRELTREKSSRGVTGEKVIAIGRPTSRFSFRAVASRECDYVRSPLRKSLLWEYSRELMIS